MNDSASERSKISLSPQTDKACVEQLNKLLVFEGDSFRWKDTLDQLKIFFAKDLNLPEPPSGVWPFSTKEYEVKWQKSTKLVVVRDNSDKFMLNCLMKSLANGNPVNRPIYSAIYLNDSSVEIAASLDNDCVEKIEKSVNSKLDCILKALSDIKQISTLLKQNLSLKKSRKESGCSKHDGKSTLKKK